MASSHDLISTITDLLGGDAERVEQRLDRLDIAQMLSLVDAVATENAEQVRDLIGDDVAEDEDEAEVETKMPPRRERAARQAKPAPAAPPVAEGGYAANIGDEVLVDGQEGIVKIARGPNDTVGVMIDGELTMVNKGKVQPLTEHVLGMSGMPDLCRMLELAGLPPMDEVPALPAPDAAQAEPTVTTIELPAEGEPAAGDDPKAAIDAAIDQLEQLLPMLRVGDYKDVSQRIQKALNVINESLVRVLRDRRLVESKGRPDSLRVSAHVSEMLRHIEGILRRIRTAFARQFAQQDKSQTYDRAFATLADLIQSIETLIRPPQAATEARRPSRSFKDYLDEMEADAQQAIGNNRADAIKSLKTRLGSTATIQDASKAFDKMRTSGKIKQNGNKMTMPVMGDDELQTMASGNSGTNPPTK